MSLQTGGVVPTDSSADLEYRGTMSKHSIRAQLHQQERPRPVSEQRAMSLPDQPARCDLQRVSLRQRRVPVTQRASGRCWSEGLLALVGESRIRFCPSKAVR